MKIQHKIMLAGAAGFVGMFFLNLSVQYFYPSYTNMLFHPQWKASSWVLGYLFFLFLFAAGVLVFVFKHKPEKNALGNEADFIRIIPAAPLFLFGLFLVASNVFDPGWDKMDELLFGLLYLYSAYLLFMPLRNKVTLPTRLSVRNLKLIAVALCLAVFLLPFSALIMPSRLYAGLFSSAHESGYIYSLFAIAFAIGANLKLERGASATIVFVAIGVSLFLVFSLVASMIIMVMSSLP